MQKAFEPAGRKAFRDSYLAAVLICIALFLAPGVQAQIDTTQIRQQINAAGYDWKSGAFLGALRPPRDTFKLKVADSGAIAYVNGNIYAWTGHLWRLSSGAFSADSIPNANSITRGLLYPDLLFYFSAKVDSLTLSNDSVFQYRDGFDKYFAFKLPAGSTIDTGNIDFRLDTLGAAVNKWFRFYNGAGGVRIMVPVDDFTSIVRSFSVNSSWASLDSNDNTITLNIPQPFTPSAGDNQLMLGNGAGIDPSVLQTDTGSLSARITAKIDQTYADAHYQAHRPALDSNSYLQNGSVDNQLLWKPNDSTTVVRGVYITGSGVSKTIRDSAIIYTITGSGGASALADLSDVDVSGAAENDILALNASGTWEHTPGLIAELTDPADGDMLVQDGGVFVNRPALQVTLTDPADGDMIVKDGSDWVNMPSLSVDITGISNGDVFAWNASTSTAEPHTPSWVPSGGTDGQVLKKVSGAAAWANESGGGGGAAALGDLSDVDITGAAENDILVRNSTGTWEHTPGLLADLTSVADGDMLFYSAGSWVNHPGIPDGGTSGQVLKKNSSTDYDYDWSTPSSGFADPMTTVGDIIIRKAGNTTDRLAGNATTAVQVLSSIGSGSAATAPTWRAVTKGDIGLNDVENTALSTWAGASSITTLGTIGTGSWNATAIAVNKGGTNKASWTVGSIPYASAATTIAEIAPNTTSTRKFLQQTSTGAPTFVQPADADVVFSDVTTGNASTSAHGFVKKLSGNSTDYYGGDGSYHAVPSAVNIYNTDGVLTGSRTLGGASNSLTLGSSGSPLNSLSIYTNVGIDIVGAISYYESTNPTDANYSATLGSNIYVLPAITANRSLTLPTPASGAAELFFLNKNTSAFSWNLSTTLKDAAGNTVSSLANSAFYDLMYDPDDAVWLVKSVSGSGGGVATTSGSYSATVANQSNATNVTSISSNYSRAGNRVHVWGVFQYKYTTSATQTVVTISVPFASSSTAATGTAVNDDNGSGDLSPCVIRPDGASTGAVIVFTSGGSGGGSLFSEVRYSFDYIIQ